MDNIVEVKGLFFGYDKVDILEDINLSIKRGEMVAVVGPNGSAKTTLIKLMVGLIPSYRQGEIQLFGTPINKFKQWKKIGYLSQKAASFNQSFPATVEEVIASNAYWGINPFGIKKTEKRERIAKALSIVGMEEFTEKRIGQLSGGQQQRVFIARALVNQPQLLILDEPTTGIDYKSQVQFYKLMTKLNQELGITIIMVSHDIGAVSKNVDCLICVGDGKAYQHRNARGNIPYHIIQRIYGIPIDILEHTH